MTSNDPNEKEFEQLSSDPDKSILLKAEEYPDQPLSDEKDGNSFAADSTGAPLLKFAGFWMRFWAYLLDLIVIGSIDRLIINPLFRAFDIPLSEMSIFAPISIATAITFYAYFVLMTKFFGQTLGKMAFGLKVVDLDGNKPKWGTILFREWIGRFISSFIIVGYVVVAFLPKKQGLHDLFADTTVIHEK